jgi:hypothetical protein
MERCGLRDIGLWAKLLVQGVDVIRFLHRRYYHAIPLPPPLPSSRPHYQGLQFHLTALLDHCE